MFTQLRKTLVPALCLLAGLALFVATPAAANDAAIGSLRFATEPIPGVSIGDVTLDVPENAGFTAKISEFRPESAAEFSYTPEVLIEASTRYYLTIDVQAKPGYTIGDVAAAMQQINEVYPHLHPLTHAPEGDAASLMFCYEFFYGDRQVVDVLPLTPQHMDLVAPLAGKPLYRFDEAGKGVLDCFVPQDASGVQNATAEWGVVGVPGPAPADYMPKAGDTVFLNLTFHMKGATTYGRTYTEEEMRAWFSNVPSLTNVYLADGVHSGAQLNLGLHFKVGDSTTAVQPTPPAPAAPTGGSSTTLLTIGSNTLVRTVNGVTGTSTMDVAPYINPGENRTMLPLRAVGEILGLQVEWDAATRTVTVTGEGVNAAIPVDSKVIIMNGKTITVDASAEIKNGCTMMSIANLGTALGLERDKNIIWDGTARTVTIVV